MLEHGSNNSLPAKYRIALALSTAFLIHTLLLAGTPSFIPDPPVTHRQQLNLELVAAASTPETPASANTPDPGEKSATRNPPFKATPDNIVSAPENPVLTASRSQQKTASKKSLQAPTTKKKADQTSPETFSNPESEPSESGSRSQVSTNQISENVTRISQSPSERDPYLIELAMHLATQIETLRIPAMKELDHSSTMEIELHLMESGALTRVRVTRSTGIEQIDSAAYRAALSASPYPEPPPDQSGKSRFEVKLVFAPSRL
jgi:protein TonB